MQIRDYRPEDERSWVHCRALSFLDTCYYDDVWPTRRHEDDAVELVAVDPDGRVVGILDLSFAPDGAALRATIDTVAIHPAHRRRGLAGALLERGLDAVRRRGAVSLDAWTREDVPAMTWYAAHGFTERFRYLHVHAQWDDDLSALTSTDDSRIVGAFLHAGIEHEANLRARYRRVYVCRQFLREPRVSPAAAAEGQESGPNHWLRP